MKRNFTREIFIISLIEPQMNVNNSVPLHLKSLLKKLEIKSAFVSSRDFIFILLIYRLIHYLIESSITLNFAPIAGF